MLLFIAFARRKLVLLANFSPNNPGTSYNAKVEEKPGLEYKADDDLDQHRVLF